MFFSNLSQFGVNGERLCVLHTDFMWLPAVLLVGHACECNFISVLFCSQLTALSVRQHCRPRSISRNSFPNTWMDLFSYVSFIHESSKLFCTCSRKYVKETCTYLYQPLKQNSATEFFFFNSFGLPVFWGSAWATSALAAQASAVRWSSRVRSVMGKIKEFKRIWIFTTAFQRKKSSQLLNKKYLTLLPGTAYCFLSEQDFVEMRPF